MRTTLTLDDKAFDFANQYAAARALRLGEAVSELILSANQNTAANAAQSPTRPRKQNGVWVFDLPATAPVLRSETVRAYLDDNL